MGKRLGSCYESAFGFLLHPCEDWPNAVMVHGRPTLTREPFTQYGHAWIENAEGTLVYDTESNSMWPTQVYYRVGKINPADNFRYTLEQAARFACSHMHYGPWEGVEACAPLKRRKKGR
jgi:hypothetical protein